MKRKLKTILLFQLLVIGPIIGQDSQSSTYTFTRVHSHDLVMGYTYQGIEREEKYPELPIRSLEFGYARAWITQGGPHGPTSLIFSATQSFAIQREFLTGTRVGLASRAMVGHLGLYLAYYTDFHYGNLKFSPELGFASQWLKAVLGFNIPTLYNRDFEDLQHASLQFTVAVNVPVHRKLIPL